MSKDHTKINRRKKKVGRGELLMHERGRGRRGTSPGWRKSSPLAARSARITRNRLKFNSPLQTLCTAKRLPNIIREMKAELKQSRAGVEGGAAAAQKRVGRNLIRNAFSHCNFVFSLNCTSRRNALKIFVRFIVGGNYGSERRAPRVLDLIFFSSLLFRLLFRRAGGGGHDGRNDNEIMI